MICCKPNTEIIWLSNAVWSPQLTCGLILNVPVRLEHDLHDIRNISTGAYYCCEIDVCSTDSTGLGGKRKNNTDWTHFIQWYCDCNLIKLITSVNHKVCIDNILVWYPILEHLEINWSFFKEIHKRLTNFYVNTSHNSSKVQNLQFGSFVV